MHCVQRPETTAFKRLCKRFCFIIDFKALIGQRQHSHNFIATHVIWNAAHFVFKRFGIQHRQLARVNRRQDCQNRLRFNSNSGLRLVIKRAL